MAAESNRGAKTESATLTDRLTAVVEQVSVERLLVVYTVLVATYVYLPMLSLIVFSFNASGLTFPISEVSLVWYTELLNNQGLIEATIRSLKLAFVTMIITTILATMLAVAYHYGFRGKRVVLYLIILGIVIPGIAYGIGARILLVETLGLPRNLWLAITVHVVWTLPFSFIVLLAGFPPNLAQNEHAARVMGADTLSVFRRITFPQIAPTVLGAAVFAFTLSYNEATRGLLLVGRDTTMPTEIFTTVVGERASPEMFALGSITTVVSVILLVVAGGIVIYSRRRGRTD